MNQNGTSTRWRGAAAVMLPKPEPSPFQPKSCLDIPGQINPKIPTETTCAGKGETKEEIEAI